MKSLCVVLLLGLCVPGCSTFTKSGRMDHAYYKQLKHVKAEREKRRKETIKKQAKIPKENTLPPLEQNVQSQPEGQ
jgi:hypothetical protein